MNIQTMKSRGIERLVLAVVMVIATSGCAEPEPSQAERDAWNQWTSRFVDAACAQLAGCATTPEGAACYETGSEAAEMAYCDAAVMFYIANRKELDECINNYPTDCSVTPGEACPLITGDRDFETICK